MNHLLRMGGLSIHMMSLAISKWNSEAAKN